MSRSSRASACVRTCQTYAPRSVRYHTIQPQPNEQRSRYHPKKFKILRRQRPCASKVITKIAARSKPPEYRVVTLPSSSRSCSKLFPQSRKLQFAWCIYRQCVNEHKVNKGVYLVQKREVEKTIMNSVPSKLQKHPHIKWKLYAVVNGS